MGIMASKQTNFRVFNVSVTRAVQGGLQLYGGANTLIQDFSCDSCGGGGNQALMILAGAQRTTVVRLRLLETMTGGDSTVKDCGADSMFKESQMKVIKSGCR